MRPARFSVLVDKTVEAAVAAIEVYNKPSFSYREEAFSILMINAWELLLKARILKENDNRVRSIEVWEPGRKKDGTLGRKLGPWKNRTGNRFTVNVQTAWQTVRGYSRHGIDDVCIQNLELLLEIRDNAVHLSNKGRALRKGIQEVSAATLRNFLKACSIWFGRDLSENNFADVRDTQWRDPNGVRRHGDWRGRSAAGLYLPQGNRVPLRSRAAVQCRCGNAREVCPQIVSRSHTCAARFACTRIGPHRSD
jgi:hypothetical protein